MDTLLSLKVFREVAEQGSFALAARRLQLSAPAVTKHVAHLEHAVGARLLHRTSRQVSLTEAGAVYLEQTQEALDALQAGEASIGSSLEAPRGTLKVTAPVWCSTARFARALLDYRNRYPDVLVDLRLQNQKVDLVAEGFDLALRATREPSPTLIVRHLTDIRFHLVALPSYLDRVGRPRTPGELTRHACILPSHTKLDGLEMEGPTGRVTLRLQGVLMTDSTTMDYHAMHAGFGIAFLPWPLVADDLAAGRIEQVLPDYQMLPVPLYAAYTSRRYLAPKVRTFIDFMGEALQGC